MDHIVTVTTPPVSESPAISPWSRSRGKRALDLVFAGLAIVPCLPLMALICFLVTLTSRGPVLFRQTRMGENGRLFNLLKFRTMFHNRKDSGPGVTRRGDPRITPVGKFLRGCKLDELPQLFNVLRGDMSLIGPRPDLPEFLQALAPEYRGLLALKPGVTGWATLQFRNEEELLATVPKEQLISYYTETVLPLKAQLDLTYAQQASLLGDLGILWRTLRALAQ